MSRWIKRIANHIDGFLNIDSYRRLAKLGIISQNASPELELLREKVRLLTPEDGILKLHLGCGKVHLKGFINIDHRATSATDLECDIQHLPFDDDSVTRIETYHLIEHLSRPQAIQAVSEWRRILKSNGVLVIECPDFDAACREYLEGREERIYNIFGLQRFEGDSHGFGYNFSRLRKLLTDQGFRSIVQKPPTDYHKDQEPCMRVEAIK